MYFIGGDHYNNRIPHEDFQIFCHRVYAKLNWYLPDHELRHRLYYDVFKTTGSKNDFYTRDDTSLKNFLADCKTNNIVPIINNNATYLDPNMPTDEYARRSKIIDDLMHEVGFDLAFQALMNEPGARHSTPEYVNYVNAAKAKIKHYKVIAGNDEYNMLDWNYLLDNAIFDILGVHPLSSLGYPANWNILTDWKTMATARNKPIIITEGGSWFKSYFSLEGWTVIKDLILKAKDLEYLATLIVLLDVNEGSYPKLGFRRFTKDYKSIISVSKYWDDFIDLVNKEGKKYIPLSIITEEEDMKLEMFYYRNRPKYLIKVDPKGYGIRFLRACFGLFDSNIFEEGLETEVRQYQIDNNLLVDGKVGPETFGNMIKIEDYYKHYCWVHSLWARGL